MDLVIFMGDVPIEVFLVFWGISSLITIPIILGCILLIQPYLSILSGLSFDSILSYSLLYGLVVGWFVAFWFILDIRG